MFLLVISWPDAPTSEEEFATITDLTARVADIRSMPWVVPVPTMLAYDSNGDELPEV